MKSEKQQNQALMDRKKVLTRVASSLENSCETKKKELAALRDEMEGCKENMQQIERTHGSTKTQLKAKEQELVRPVIPSPSF